MRKNADKPWVANYPPLQEWLQSRNAQCAWQRPITDDPEAPGSGYIEMWLVGSAQVIVLVRSHQMGWDLFTSCPDGSIVATFNDADARCMASPEGECGGPWS